MTRLLFAGALAMLISLFGTKALINWLTTHRSHGLQRNTN